MKLLTTRSERRIRMEYAPRPVSSRARVLFPILVTLVVCLLVPAATPLIGMLMLGNLLRESDVVERLSNRRRMRYPMLPRFSWAWQSARP